MNSIELTTIQSQLLEALNYNGSSAIAFHGNQSDSAIDLRNLISRELGYQFESNGYELFESAATELVTLGFAQWAGNRWLYATAEGIVKYEQDAEEF